MEIYPQLYCCGISLSEFKKLNMKEIQLILKGYELKKESESKENDVLAWEIGRYVRVAILSSLDNKNKYPKMPITLEQKDQNVDVQTEEQMLNILDKFVSKK